MSSTDSDDSRLEAAITAAAPLLDLVLSVGERISKITEPVDYEYYPVHEEAGEGSPEA